MQQRGLGVQELLDLRERPTAAAFDDIRCNRPRAARETDQRDSSAELMAHEPDGVEHEAQLLLGIGYAEPVDIARAAHGSLDSRSLAGLELEPELHRVWNRQDVREQDRGIEPESRERLQRDLAREIRRRAELEKTAGVRARSTVLGR
jgi:hypothetical protein